MSCDGNIERYIRNKHFDELNSLSAEERFVKKLDLTLDLLTFEVRDDDEILGWFNFNEQRYEQKLFDDENLTESSKEIIYKCYPYGCRTTVDRGHTLVDYEYILKNGLNEYERRIDEQLQANSDNKYLLAMKETLELVRKFTLRLAAELDKMIADCSSTEQRSRLEAIRFAMEKAPFYPAISFRDAVQSIWLIHFLTPLAEDAWYSISLGRADQYLYPYYKRFLESGATKEDAKRILYNFYKLLNSYADGACLLNVGGESYNELSELIIECQKELALPAPILAARVTENTPDSIWNSLIDEKLFLLGQPTFYGEQSCVNALLEKGLEPKKAKSFSNNSCMGISIAGEEFNSMWGCVFSVSAALEAALNKGALVTKSGAPVIPDIGEISCLDELYQEFEKCASYLMDISLSSYLEQAKVSEQTKPDCLVSILTEGCIERHMDRISGANYHNVTVECMGTVNVSDGICAIDKLVFCDKKYTLEEINNAVKNNFAGYENVRNDILCCSKFGQNSKADEYAVKVCEILQKIIRKHNKDRLFFSPSLHTLDVNVSSGSTWGAGYDGRLAGTPFAKNGGASNLARTSAPTSMILSASKLPLHKFYGGQPIDVSFDISLVREHKKELATLIKTYLHSGGLQFQVNALSSKELRAALDAPKQYPNLTVRIGGYSILFSRLTQKAKEEFIERFEKEGN